MPLSDPWSQIPNEQLQFDVEEPVCGDLQNSLSDWFHKTLNRRLSYLTRRVGGGGGFKSTIYFAKANGEEFVIRVPHPGTGWNARLIGTPEYHSIAGVYSVNRLSALGQPVPELVSVERHPSLFGRPFAVWRRVSGIHMADYSEQWTTWPYPEEQWGEFLRACHAIEPIRGAGPVDDEGIGLCSSWAEFIRHISAAHISTYASYLPPGFKRSWDCVMERFVPILDSRPIRLLHMESNGYCNLILDPDAHTLKAVVDFEEVTAGDPLFEIVYTAWHLGKPGIADHGGRTCFDWRRFECGYGDIEWKHPLIPVYQGVILLEKLWRGDRESRVRRLVGIVRRMPRASTA